MGPRLREDTEGVWFANQPLRIFGAARLVLYGEIVCLGEARRDGSPPSRGFGGGVVVDAAARG